MRGFNRVARLLPRETTAFRSCGLLEMMQSWRLEPGTDCGAQISALLESPYAPGVLRASTNAVLLGEQYHLRGAEDISEMDLEYGWYPAREMLRSNDAHYCSLMGEVWVHQAYAELDIDIESWRTGREGNGRIVAVKE